MKDLLILPLLVFAFSCAGGNLKIQVNGDYSGRITVLERRIVSNAVKQPPPAWKLKLESSNKLEVVERVYSFQNSTAINIPGIGMRVFKEVEEDSTTYLLYINTGKDSPLLAFLQVDLENNLKLVEEAKKRDDLLRFNTLSEHIIVELQLPAEVKSAKFTDQRDLTDWGVRVDPNSKIVVKLPISEFSKDRFKTTEVKILFIP